MTPAEIVHQITSGTTNLDLTQRLSQLVGFGDIIDALRSNQTIQSAECMHYIALKISREQWSFLVGAIGAIPHLQDLTLWHICGHVYQNLLTIGWAVHAATSLRRLSLGLIGSQRR